MFATFVLLVLFSGGRARPLALDQTVTLADKIEQLHEMMAALKTKEDLEEMEREAAVYGLLADLAEGQQEEGELVQERSQVQTLGQVSREEANGSRFARKHRDVVLKGLMEGSVVPADVDEEALQNYIERFHKTLRNKPDEVWCTLE